MLQQLAESSDAERRETTSIGALASALGAEEPTLEEHIDALVACELAHVAADGHVRITITGEELLALDADDLIVVDPTTRSGDTDA